MPSEKPHHELPCRAAPFEALYAPAQCFAALPVSLHRPAMIDIGYCRAGDGGRSGRSAQKVKCGQFQLCSDFLAGSSFRPRAPAVQEPAALPNGQKEGGLAIHTVLLCLFGQSTTWGYACAAPSSSPESGACRSLRLPNRPFFDRNRPFPRHGRGSPSQPPLLMACARAARISSACVQHQTERPMRAHRRQMQGRRRSRRARSRGTRSRRIFRERQNVSCCAPSACRTSPLCTRNPLFRREAPSCAPIAFDAAELATITCQQAHPASEQRPRLTPPAASLR